LGQILEKVSTFPCDLCSSVAMSSSCSSTSADKKTYAVAAAFAIHNEALEKVIILSRGSRTPTTQCLLSESCKCEDGIDQTCGS